MRKLHMKHISARTICVAVFLVCFANLLLEPFPFVSCGKVKPKNTSKPLDARSVLHQDSFGQPTAPVNPDQITPTNNAPNEEMYDHLPTHLSSHVYFTSGIPSPTELPNVPAFFADPTPSRLSADETLREEQGYDNNDNMMIRETRIHSFDPTSQPTFQMDHEDAYNEHGRSYDEISEFGITNYGTNDLDDFQGDFPEDDGDFNPFHSSAEEEEVDLDEDDELEESREVEDEEYSEEEEEGYYSGHQRTEGILKPNMQKESRFYGENCTFNSDSMDIHGDSSIGNGGFWRSKDVNQVKTESNGLMRDEEDSCDWSHPYDIDGIERRAATSEMELPYQRDHTHGFGTGSSIGDEGGHLGMDSPPYEGQARTTFALPPLPTNSFDEQTTPNDLVQRDGTETSIMKDEEDDSDSEPTPAPQRTERRRRRSRIPWVDLPGHCYATARLRIGKGKGINIHSPFIVIGFGCKDTKPDKRRDSEFDFYRVYVCQKNKEFRAKAHFYIDDPTPRCVMINPEALGFLNTGNNRGNIIEFQKSEMNSVFEGRPIHGFGDRNVVRMKLPNSDGTWTEVMETDKFVGMNDYFKDFDWRGPPGGGSSGCV